jgi:hypothetical protein
MKMTFQEIRIIATGPCITNQLRDVNTIINEDKIYFAFPQRREGVSVSENQFHFATKEVSMSENELVFFLSTL